MTQTKLSGGTVHEIPKDLQEVLVSDNEALEKWEGLTALARNEWICWAISVKQQKTRDEHVRRVVEELLQGKRRPCCWVGCIHRTDKALSPSVRGILAKQANKSSNHQR